MTSLGRGKAIVVRMSSSTKDVGFWSTVLATVFSIIYFVGQLAEWAGLLGSQGGPSSSSTPLGLVLLLSPVFFLGSSFLVMVVSIHQVASSDKRIWGHTAVVFASTHAILVSTVILCSSRSPPLVPLGARLPGLRDCCSPPSIPCCMP